MTLTDRDEEIIQWVAQLRFASQDQIQRLLFSPAAASACKRRLSLLYHNGYLDRRYLPLRSAFGSARALYCLDRRGYDLLTFRYPEAHWHWRAKDNDRELYFLEHFAATNDVRVCFTLAARSESFELQWTDERTLRAAVGRRTGRPMPGPDAGNLRSEQNNPPAIPDGAFTLVDEDFSWGFAVELDRGNVEEKPFRQKIDALLSYWRSGDYKASLGERQLRVLFVTTPTGRDPKRLERMKQWTERQGGKGLFWFTTSTALRPTTALWEPIWLVAGRDGRYPLFRSS